MFDCANVEMRELLPELVAGTLDSATRTRVEEHVTTCAECAAELEALRVVRAAYAAAPAIDVGRVVAALPKPARAPRRGREPVPVKRWIDWRIAAALTTITVGGLSLAVTERLGRKPDVEPPSAMAVNPDAPLVAQPRPVQATPAPRTDTGVRPGTPRATTAGPRKAQLAFGGGVDELDDASLRALLGALDEIDRAPVAPSAEPDRTPVLPVIKEGVR